MQFKMFPIIVRNELKKKNYIRFLKSINQHGSLVPCFRGRRTLISSVKLAFTSFLDVFISNQFLFKDFAPQFGLKNL